MYLLYLDDSGATKNPNEKYVFLAGICVYERSPYFLSQQLDELAKQTWSSDWEKIEFRGSDIFGGKRQWRGIDKAARIEIYKKALSLIHKSNTSVRLFGAAVNKSAISPQDAMEYTFEQLCNRFDRFLKRIHHSGRTEHQGQRGLIIFDKSSYETSLQGLAKEFREIGHKWGVTRNIVDVPLFVDSKATRMIQYADMIAYALRHRYEYGDPYYFDMIAQKFDGEGGIVHGLHHYTPKEDKCRCLACVSKESRMRLVAGKKQ